MEADVNDSRALRKNYLFNTLDGGFFGLTLGLASFTTVIPLFVSNLTHSAILIGLIPAIQTVGWQIPQLLTAGHLSRMDRFKPAVMKVTIHERIPFIALALIAWFVPGMDHTLALVLTYLTLIWFALGGGLTANPWLNMLGKIFPGNVLGTFLGIQSAALSLCASLGAFLAGLLLQSNPGSQGFAFCFLAASVASMISFLFLNQTIENKRPCDDEIPVEKSIWQDTLRILRTDVPFRWFLVTRVLAQFCSMAFAFYIVYAVRILGVNEFTAGILTSVLFISQVVANPALGFVSDRIGRLFAIQIGAICGAASALIAGLVQDSNWMILSLALAGIANTAFFTVAMAYSLEFSEDADRPTYVGMANTLVVPGTIAAPLIGGWLADASGYPSTFLLAAGAGILTFISGLFLVRSRKASTNSEREAV